MNFVLFQKGPLLKLSLAKTGIDWLQVILLFSIDFFSFVSGLVFLSFLPTVITQIKKRSLPAIDVASSILGYIFIVSFILAFAPGFGCATGETSASACLTIVLAIVAMFALKSLRETAEELSETFKSSDIANHYVSTESLELVGMLNSNLLQFFVSFAGVVVTANFRQAFFSFGNLHFYSLAIAAGFTSIRAVIRLTIDKLRLLVVTPSITNRVIIALGAYGLHMVLSWDFGLFVPQLLGFGFMILAVAELQRTEAAELSDTIDLTLSENRIGRNSFVPVMSEALIFSPQSTLDAKN